MLGQYVEYLCTSLPPPPPAPDQAQARATPPAGAAAAADEDEAAEAEAGIDAFMLMALVAGSMPRVATVAGWVIHGS